MNYYMYPFATDMRKSFYTLSGIVTNLMGRNVQDGDAFIFLNRSCNSLKVLHMECGGLVIYSTPVLSDHRASFSSLVRSHCKPLFVSVSEAVKADLQVACHSLDGFWDGRYLCAQWKRAMRHIRTIQRVVFHPNCCVAVCCCNS